MLIVLNFSLFEGYAYNVSTIINLSIYRSYINPFYNLFSICGNSLGVDRFDLADKYLIDINF